jgi:outer membrane protein, multidrug efflux system
MRPIRLIVISPPLLLALAGCTVGPSYVAPTIKTPEQFGSMTGQIEQASPIAVPQASPPDAAMLATWWTVFKDPALDSLIARGVSGNLDLKTAAARLRESRALRGVAGSDQFPKVDAKASANRRRNSERLDSAFSDGGGERTAFEYGLDASWELDVFGGIRRGVEAADADLMAAQEDERSVLVSLVAEIARSYVEFRGQQQQIALTESTIKSQTESLELTRSRFKAGLSADLDVAQAEAQLATRQSQLPPFRATMRQAAHRLSVLLGLPPGAVYDELLSSAAIPTVPSTVPVGLPAELVRRRPDIRRAERRLAAATARIGVATADLYPKFSISGSFAFDAGDVGKLDMNSRAWSIGPAMRWNLFDGKRIRNNIKAADARTEQALLGYEQSVLTALEEAENGLTNFIQEQARRRALQEAVVANERAVQLATDRYRSGVGDFFDVLDNQRQLFATQQQLVQSETSVTQSLIVIYKALGGGWSETSNEVPSESPAATP